MKLYGLFNREFYARQGQITFREDDHPRSGDGKFSAKGDAAFGGAPKLPGTASSDNPSPHPSGMANPVDQHVWDHRQKINPKIESHPEFQKLKKTLEKLGRDMSGEDGVAHLGARLPFSASRAQRERVNDLQRRIGSEVGLPRSEDGFIGFIVDWEKLPGWSPMEQEKYSQGQHAPKGGVTIGGTFYRGGEFIPGSVVERATPEEKSAIEGKTTPTREGFEAVSREKKEFRHADPAESELPEEFHARAKALRLPPAWTGVQIAADPKSPLQAVGYDAKGRAQYRYSAEHSGKQAAEKFERVKRFVGKLPEIRGKISEGLTSESESDREAAAVLALIDKTGFRVGSDRDTKAEKKAHGASTLDASHVEVSGDSVTFSFTGKKGVDIRQTIKDAALAKMIGERKSRGGKLFRTTDSEVRDYLHKIGGKFKVKDFRTAVAADTALQAINSLEAPKSDKEFKQLRTEVGKIVSDKLGNTPTVALASYIPPEVFSSWQTNLAQWKASKPSSSKSVTTTTPAKGTGGTPKKPVSTPTTNRKLTEQLNAAMGFPAKSAAAASYSLRDALEREFYARGLSSRKDALIERYAVPRNRLAEYFDRELYARGFTIARKG